MKLHNTQTKQLEEFVPINPDEVLVYTCGPTVYGYQHIGNYTAYIYWDVLVRALEANGYAVKRLLNMTDVGHLVSDEDEGEDKIEKGARLSGKTVWEVAEFFAEDFLKNFKALGLIEPTKIARATEYIDENLALIRTLKEKGYTYQIDDGIYYDTSKFSKYANFARLDLEKLKAGARVDFNEQKKNVSDFALWKFIRNGEKHDMRWETPEDLWETEGEPLAGYPGWHIECSAIIKAELGDTIDIHTGGIDHIPVHHTNEVAQSEAANESALANYWLHCSFITIDGQKISKSLGNIYTFDDLAERGFSHMDYKMWVLQGNFQTDRNFSFENLVAAQNRLRSWLNMAALRHQISSVSGDGAEDFYKLLAALAEALGNNLNTAVALALVDEMFTNLTDPRKMDRKCYIMLLESIDRMLGLDLLGSTPDIDEETKRLILIRQRARDEKSWKESDKLRTEIETAAGIVLKDMPGYTIWQYK